MRRRLALALAGVVAVGALAVGHAASLPLTSGQLTTFETCVVTATPNPTTAEIDAYVDQANPAVNDGTLLLLAVQPADTGGVTLRTYIRFGLSNCSPAIPANATVRGATLQLALNTFPASLCETEDVFANTSTWTETGITWATQPAGTTPDVPASAGRTSFASVGGAAGCTNSVVGAYVPWNVTADVQKWVAGTATNFGWMIRNDTEVAGTTADYVDFIAKETNVVGTAPELIITYSP
ncbi:MAG: hypothetical protein NVS3B18_05900 [Candidatus Dormibacteria bacterium]